MSESEREHDEGADLGEVAGAQSFRGLDEYDPWEHRQRCRPQEFRLSTRMGAFLSCVDACDHPIMRAFDKTVRGWRDEALELELRVRELEKAMTQPKGPRPVNEHRDEVQLFSRFPETLLTDAERGVVVPLLDHARDAAPLTAGERELLTGARNKIANDDVPTPAPVRERPLLSDPDGVYESARMVSKAQTWAAVLKLVRSLAERGASVAPLLYLLASSLEEGSLEDPGTAIGLLLGPEDS